MGLLRSHPQLKERNSQRVSIQIGHWGYQRLFVALGAAHYSTSRTEFRQGVYQLLWLTTVLKVCLGHRSSFFSSSTAARVIGSRWLYIGVVLVEICSMLDKAIEDIVARGKFCFEQHGGELSVWRHERASRGYGTNNTNKLGTKIKELEKKDHYNKAEN